MSYNLESCSQPLYNLKMNYIGIYLFLYLNT